MTYASNSRPNPSLPNRAPSYAGSFADFHRPGKVHSGIFTWPQIFDAEIERIFYRTWLYIGHESEVPEAGDFRLRQMGRQPVILVRGASGAVNVLINRCRHRGAVVAETECGKVGFFKCWWHGFIYNSDGALVEVPRKDAYPEGFQDEIGGLSRPARVDSYRGFIFASFSADGIALGEHLGPATKMIDYLVEASPTGKIQVGPGVSKTTYKGNWKFVGMDGFHVETVHASVLAVWQEKENSGLGSTHRGNFLSDKAASATRDLGHGHVMLDYRKQRVGNLSAYLEHLESMDGGADYIASMRRAYGDDRANELLAVAGDPHVGIFPNMQILANHVRLVNPVAVDETNVFMFPVTFVGAPDAINQARVRSHEFFYSGAGSGSPDDAEVFERAQRGLQAEVDPWIDISRGMNREWVDSDGTIVGTISDEVTQRGQMREWARLMAAE